MALWKAPTSNFQEDLAYSHDQSDQPFWGEVYRQAFPDIATMTDVRKDGRSQRAGVDRIIVTHSGRIWKIDEKARRKVYGEDIFLEYISNDTWQTPGWVVKDLACDFIAYAQVPLRRCFLLPVMPLQRSWLKHGETWRKNYGECPAKNNGYTTWGCPVPYAELMKRVSEAMYFTWREGDV